MRCEYSADCGRNGAEVLRQFINNCEGILIKIDFPRNATLIETMDPSLHLLK
jgi:hypothetical protein